MWFYVVISILVVAMLVSFIRWFFIRPRRMKLSEGSIEELTRFADEFRRAADYMSEFSKTLELRSLLEWQRKNEEILKTLRQMNKLLQELNEFFEFEATQLAPAEGSGEPTSAVRRSGSRSDGKPISQEEIQHTDWSQLITRLREQTREPDDDPVPPDEPE